MSKKWVLSQRKTGEGEPVIKLPNGLWAATTCIDASGSGERITASDARKNAELIVAMQNLCVTLNPSDPLAAANALADAMVALEGLECYARQLINDLPQKRDWLAPDIENNVKAYADDARKALAALKGGEQ